MTPSSMTEQAARLDRVADFCDQRASRFLGQARYLEITRQNPERVAVQRLIGEAAATCAERLYTEASDLRIQAGMIAHQAANVSALMHVVML